MGKLAAMRLGALVTAPMIIGGIPFGLIFGSLAISQGLEPWVPLALSLFVFAGSSQFVALGLLATGTPAWVIVFTTLVINLRHILYAADLLKYVRHLPLGWRVILAFGLTDEAYAGVKPYYANGKFDLVTGHWAYFGSVVAMYLMWNTTTVIGMLAGELIPGMSEWGLEFAMVATFIGIITPYLRNLPYWGAFVVAGSAALLLADLPNNLGMLLAALLGVAAGVGIEQMQDKLKLQRGAN